MIKCRFISYDKYSQKQFHTNFIHFLHFQFSSGHLVIGLWAFFELNFKKKGKCSRKRVANIFDTFLPICRPPHAAAWCFDVYRKACLLSSNRSQRGVFLVAAFFKTFSRIRWKKIIPQFYAINHTKFRVFLGLMTVSESILIHLNIRKKLTKIE